MNTLSQNRGFVKTLIFLTMAVVITFAIVIAFAKYFVPGSLSGTVGIGGPTSPFSNTGSTNPGTNPLLDFSNFGGDNSTYTDANDRSTPNTDGAGKSPYYGKVTLSYGSASSAYQTFEEYVTLNNYGAAVNITGWTLTNSKGSRPIQNIQNNYIYPVADSATIGTGTGFLNPTGVFQTGPIVLQKNDLAYLVTGRPYSQYPFPISTSFRENICVGYLKNYPFTPSLNSYCPSITNDPLIKTITDQCYDYVRSIPRCMDPEKDDKKNFDAVTSQCQQFIRPRLNYAGCVDNNQNQANFSTNTWRIFLGKDKELWSNSRETITLYDASGLIVDQVSY